MKKFKDSVLESWTGPASDSEEERIRNTERMIKSALSDSELFDDLTYEVFIQGSYANNTNVKTNSDIDINIMLKSTLYSEKCEGKNDSDYGFIDGTISYNEFKNRVLIALAKKFKSENVSQKNKSISIQASSYRVEADCIPSFQYRNYKRINSLVSYNFKEGIKYFATDGTEVINYPKEHINNGIEKNKLTSKKYKRTVRLVKRLRNKMKEEGYYSNENITSFLIECLIWNIPNNFFLIDKSWNETIDNIITYIKSSIKDESYKEWGEVSEFFYLFHQNRKWKVSDVDEFIMKLKNYMEC